MSAPKFVPTAPSHEYGESAGSRFYRSPDVVPSPWTGPRAGSSGSDRRPGVALGNQGPDQGYALTLTRQFADRLVLFGDEHQADVLAGAVQIAMNRASIYGRAPVVYDLEIALRVWGFLDDSPPELIEARRCFEGVANAYHWREAGEVVAKVPHATLRMSPADVAKAHRADWRALLDLD